MVPVNAGKEQSASPRFSTASRSHQMVYIPPGGSIRLSLESQTQKFYHNPPNQAITNRVSPVSPMISHTGVRRSRQARPSRHRMPRAEAARVLRAPGQTVATSATLPPSDATRRGRAMRSTRWRSGETSWDCRTERSDVRRGPRRAPRPPPSPASHCARCAADQIERRGVAVKEASATGPIVLTVMRRFARSGNAERNGAARRPSGEKASKPTRSR